MEWSVNSWNEEFSKFNVSLRNQNQGCDIKKNCTSTSFFESLLIWWRWTHLANNKEVTGECKFRRIFVFLCSHNFLYLIYHWIVGRLRFRDVQEVIIIWKWRKAPTMACFLCMSSEDTNKCEICEKVFSCSRHGKTHINSKGICYPYKVEADAQKGEC